MVFKAYKDIEVAIKLARPFEQVIVDKTSIYRDNILTNILQNPIISPEVSQYFKKWVQ